MFASLFRAGGGPSKPVRGDRSQQGTGAAGAASGAGKRKAAASPAAPAKAAKKKTPKKPKVAATEQAVKKAKLAEEAAPRAAEAGRSAEPAIRQPGEEGSPAVRKKKKRRGGRKKRDDQEAAKIADPPSPCSDSTTLRKQPAQQPGENSTSAATQNSSSSLQGSAASRKRRRRRENRRLQSSCDQATADKAKKEPVAGSSGTSRSAPLLLSSAGSSVGALGKAAERLKGSRFRWLNELLYTSTGAEAKQQFESDPTLAVAYHEGFVAQRAKWPRDPLMDVVAWLRKSVPKQAVIGDFGCGEARIALALPERKIHSFDLVPVNERVTPCNLADVPLPDESLDVVVFCLALMGTDWLKFISEARRCLRPDGLLHIVEVESRFEDVGSVIKQIEAVGFKNVVERPRGFFLEFRFMKANPKRVGGNKGGLQACTYRRR